MVDDSVAALAFTPSAGGSAVAGADSMPFAQRDDIDLTEVQLLDFLPETCVHYEAACAQQDVA